MADTTLSAIYARVATVLEADPFFFVATPEPFSHDRAPNAVTDRAYRIQDGGLVRSDSTSNYTAARIDRLTVFVAKKLAFANQDALETLEDTLLGIERAVKADGPANGYHAELENRLVTRIPETDVMVGSLNLTVDYDVSEVA